MFNENITFFEKKYNAEYAEIIKFNHEDTKHKEQKSEIRRQESEKWPRKGTN